MFRHNIKLPIFDLHDKKLSDSLTLFVAYKIKFTSFAVSTGFEISYKIFPLNIFADKTRT